MQQLNLFMKNLNQQKEINLSIIENSEENIISRYQQVTECIYDLILQLKSFILNYGFLDTNEEVHFFKFTKPTLISELIYNNKVLQIMIERPPGNCTILQSYYEHELAEITSFFNKHKDFYHYYRLNEDFNDTLYFVRNKKNMLHFNENILYSFEPGFTSSHDYLVAQIIANDRLEIFLKAEIETLLRTKTFPHVDNMGKNPDKLLEWTESKSALIELIYALSANNCINNGNCDIRELSSRFEQMFNVQLPDTYRTFQDIKMRKTPIKFIDSLKASLVKKIDEDFQ